jgi:hypothetical protein
MRMGDLRVWLVGTAELLRGETMTALEAPQRQGRCSVWPLLILLASALLSHCAQEPEVDAIPPDRVTDLTVTGSTVSSLTLQWTAPGDDGVEGRAAGYDIRYSAGDISGATWGTAVRLEGLPEPSEAGVTDSVAIKGLPAGAAYSVGLRAVDESCNWSDLSNIASGMTVAEDVWLRVPSVSDGIGLDIDWTNTHLKFSANWGTAVGAEGYQYAIGTEPGATDVVDWTDAGSATRVTHSGVSLKHGTTYYFAVRAFADTTYGMATCSDGVTIDVVPPSSAVTALPAATTALTFQISWEGEDDLSGLASYSVSYREGPTGSWRSLLTSTTDTTAYFTGLADVTYYFRCCAVDSAGNRESYPATPDASTTIRVPSLPRVPWVWDGLGADEDWTTLPGYLAAHWGSAGGIEGYEYAVGSSRGGVDVVPWTSTGADTFMIRSDVNVADGGTCYVTVRVVVGSQRGPSVTSDGTRVDLYPPVSLVDRLPADTYALVLDVSWLGLDYVSGIVSYDVQVRPGGKNGFWEDWLVGTTQTSARFEVEDGRLYWFRCRAIDKAGNQEPYPDDPDAKTTYHWSIPPVPWVRDGYDSDQKWTRSLTTLKASWGTVEGAESYECALGTAPGSADAGDWTSTDVATRVTRSDLSLAHGATYYASARASAAGQVGDWLASDGITVDAVAPESWVSPLADTIVTVGFRVTWGGHDDVSGIAAFDVQWKDGATGWWQDWVTGTTGWARTFYGQQGHTYYFRSRARDAVGNQEDYPEEADALTYFRGPRRPKIALHLASHGVADCNNTPAINRVEDIVRYWPNLEDIDAFVVIFDYDCLTGYYYGLDWPAEWGSCSTITCYEDCEGRITHPREQGMRCYCGRSTGANHPFTGMAYHWLTPTCPGQITLRGDDGGTSPGILDCWTEYWYAEVPAESVYCAGVQVVPGYGAVPSAIDFTRGRR